MTITLSNSHFSSEVKNPGRIDSSFITLMNASPTFQRLFDAMPAYTTILVGTAGAGTFFNPSTENIVIDPNDFTTYANNPKMLVARISHEVAHAVDFAKSPTIVGANGLTPATSSSELRGPADYSSERGKDEGFGLGQEFLIAKELGITTFSGGQALFSEMNSAYEAMHSAGLSNAEISTTLTFIAGTEGRNHLPSTGSGANAGLTYGQTDIKTFIIDKMGFVDAFGNKVTATNYQTSNIVEYAQNDDGSYRITAINPLNGQLVTKQFSSDSKLFSTTTATVFDDTSRNETIVFADGRVVTRTVDADGVGIPASKPPSSWLQRLMSENIDTDGDGVFDVTVSAASMPQGTVIEIDSIGGSGNEASISIDDDSYLGASITTPDGSGGTNRTIEATINNKPVTITQHASATDAGPDGQLDDEDFTTTGVSIQGQSLPPGTNTSAVNAGIDNAIDGGHSVPAIITGEYAEGGASNLNNIVYGIDSSASNGGVNTDPAPGSFGGSGTGLNPVQPSDAVSLFTALYYGNPGSIATASLNAASHIFNNPLLAGAAAGIAGLGNLQSFADAWAKGDFGRAIISGVGVSQNALTIYHSYISQEIATNFPGGIEAARIAVGQGNPLAVELVGKFDSTTELLGQIGQGLAVLNVLYSLSKGDVGAATVSAIGAYAAYAEIPYVGAIIAIASIAYAVLRKQPEYEADATYQAQADGSIGVMIGNHNLGAGDDLNKIMTALQQMVKDQASANATLTNQSLGVIAERLPVVSLKRGSAFLWYADQDRGQTYAKTFDLNGKYLAPGYVEDIDKAYPWGINPVNLFANRAVNPLDKTSTMQVAESDAFYQGLEQQFSDAAVASGAIAPMWEVQTANMQRAAGVADAGLNAVQRADKHGWAYADPWSARDFAPIVLDLNGDGAISKGAAYSGKDVRIDVDNDGYAEQTQWVGPREGVLIMDRDGDGALNSGKDMFSDAGVNGSLRGVRALQEVDANGDNAITSADPAYARMKVWTDVDGDAVQDDKEVKSLADMGITRLNITNSAVGSFVRNGDTQRMETVSLTASREGIASTLIGNSLLVQKEGNIYGGYGAQLMAVSALDYTSSASTSAGHVHVNANGVTTGDELLDGQEDVTLTISAKTLLANDRSTLGAVGGSWINSVMNAYGGHAEYVGETNEFLFRPDENFNTKTGGLAHFDYTVADAQGNTSVATAYIDVAAVEDAATVEVVHGRRRGTWSDIGITTNAAGVNVYVMPNLSTVGAVLPPSQPVNPVLLGFTGPNGADLQPSSDGVIGFADGKMYFAWLGTPGMCQ